MKITVSKKCQYFYQFVPSYFRGENMFPICVWQRAVPIQKWFSIVGLTTAKCWQARVSQTEFLNFPLFVTDTDKAIQYIYSHVQTISSASFYLYIYVCLYWLLDLGELQLCAVHISLALWPSKSLQGKTMFYWKRLLLSGAVISFAETFCWKLFSTKIVF